MMTFSKGRWAIVLAGHLTLLFFIGQANYYLSPLGIQVVLMGMILSFSALELSYTQGLLSIAPVCLVLDSKTPLPFGYTLIVCLFLHTIAYALRSRVRREISASALATSIMLNVSAYAAYTFGSVVFLGSAGMHLGALALNLFASTLVTFLLNRIFFETQTSVLLLFGINLAEEQREAR